MRIRGDPLTEPKQKVFAYITNADRLLVFRHPFAPEAGIQVPAGTVERDEEPAAAVIREAREETGLGNLVFASFLGRQVCDMSDFGRGEVHLRYFFHLLCPGNPPATWRHQECFPSEGGPDPITFDFFWVPLPDGVPPLIAGHGKLLPELLARR